MKVSDISASTINFYLNHGKKITCLATVIVGLLVPEKTTLEKHDQEEFSNQMNRPKIEQSVAYQVPSNKDPIKVPTTDGKEVTLVTDFGDVDEENDRQIEEINSHEMTIKVVTPSGEQENTINLKNVANEMISKIKSKMTEIAMLTNTEDMVFVYRGPYSQNSDPAYDHVCKTYVRKVYRLKLKEKYMKLEEEKDYEKLIKDIFNNGIENAFTILEETEEKTVLPIRTGKWNWLQEDADKAAAHLGSVILEVEGTDIRAYGNVDGNVASEVRVTDAIVMGSFFGVLILSLAGVAIYDRIKY